MLTTIVAAAGAAPAAAMAAIWNGSDKDSQISTPAGSKRVARFSGTTTANIRSTAALSGKVCFAMTPTELPTNDNMTLGIANGSAGLTTGLGSDNNSAALYVRQGFFWINTTTKFTLAGGTVIGSELVFAVDVAGKLIWACQDGGNWNADSSANPASGTNGIDFSALGAGPFYIAFGMNGSHTVDCVLHPPACVALPAGFSVP